MSITKENVTIEDWFRGTRLVCPYLRYISGVWLALNENPCGKHERCKPCAKNSKDKVIIVNG